MEITTSAFLLNAFTRKVSSVTLGNTVRNIRFCLQTNQRSERLAFSTSPQSSNRLQVEVLVGRDKGKQGNIFRVIKERNWCFVEGLNCKYKLDNKTPTNPGVLTRVEQPLLVTEEVKLVDPSDNKPTDIAWRYTEEGAKVRVSIRTGRVLPVPDYGKNDEEDYVEVKTYKTSDKDTKEKELKKVTFKPKLMTFENDILEQMGIKDDRKPVKTYWY